MPRHKPSYPATPLPAGGANIYERFVPKLISRSMVKNAPYNPRQITPAARKLLRDNLERVGLVEPLVWNVRTGNLVSGHQRLEILDSLLHSPDFKMTVSAVDLDPATEKIQNVHLNNQSAQGTFSQEKMAALLLDEEFQAGGGLIASSFSNFAYELEFGFRPEVLIGNSSIGQSTDLDLEESEVSNEDGPAAGNESPSGQVEQTLRNTAEAIKARKAEYEQQSSTDPENSTDYFLMVAFASTDEKDSWLERNGFRKSLRYIGIDELLPLLRDDAR